jgi:uncharacterized lipoprotein YmbA
MHVYVLAPPLERAAPPTERSPPVALSAPTSLEVRRVLVPDYLDTTDILLRDGSHEIRVDPTGRWGERLSEGLTQALAADLAARLPRAAIVRDASSQAQRQLLINVEAMDVWPDGHCVIAAHWSVLDRGAKSAATSGSGTFDAPATAGSSSVSDANLVDAVARTVAKLADAIVSNEVITR